MSYRTLCIWTCLVLLSACALTPTPSGAIPVSGAEGIRSIGSGPFLLDFLAIKAGTEDRVVLEFDIKSIGRKVEQVTLKLPLVNLDEGGDAGIIDVFAFEGDGEITAGDFYAGERIASVEAPDGNAVRVDVTTAVKSALDAGQRSIGFRLSTETADRYFLGEMVNLFDPNLSSRYSADD